MDTKEMRKKYAALGEKWIATDPISRTAMDFNKLVAARLRKSVSYASADWKQSDWLAAAEVLVNGNRADNKVTTTVTDATFPDPVYLDESPPIEDTDVVSGKIETPDEIIARVKIEDALVEADLGISLGKGLKPDEVPAYEPPVDMEETPVVEAAPVEDATEETAKRTLQIKEGVLALFTHSCDGPRYTFSSGSKAEELTDAEKARYERTNAGVKKERRESVTITLAPREYAKAKSLAQALCSKARSLGSRIGPALYNIPFESEARLWKAIDEISVKAAEWNAESLYWKIAVSTQPLNVKSDNASKRTVWTLKRALADAQVSFNRGDYEAMRRAALVVKERLDTLMPGTEEYDIVNGALQEIRSGANIMAAAAREDKPLTALEIKRVDRDSIQRAWKTLGTMEVPREFDGVDAMKMAKVQSRFAGLAEAVGVEGADKLAELEALPDVDNDGAETDKVLVSSRFAGLGKIDPVEPPTDKPGQDPWDRAANGD